MPNVLKTIRKTIGYILGGWSPVYLGGSEGQFLDSVGIDPESIQSATGFYRAFGSIIPRNSCSDMTSSSLGSAPMWITAAQNTQGCYAYGAGGTLYTLSTFFGPDDDGGVINTSGAGNGMVEYLDYLYLATGTNIYRWGPISTTQPLLMEKFWTTSLGLGQSALTDTTYPTAYAAYYPNHVMHVHNDGYVYIADYASGLGLIHSFYIDNITGATTAAYADLKLPPGYIPMDITSYGTDLAIVASRPGQTGGFTRTADSALFLWDTTSPNFYRQVPITYGLASAVVNKNGELHVFTGDLNKGVKLLKYLGGTSFQSLCSVSEGTPPFAGAADVLGNMICWGGEITNPITAAGAFSYGYRDGKLPGDSLNFIQRISDTTHTSPVVTALTFIYNGDSPVIGWSAGDASYGIDAVRNPSYNSQFRSLVENIGRPFTIRRITVPLTNTVSATTEIVPVVWIDNGNATYTLPTINSTNYPNSELVADYTDLNISGKQNYLIQYLFTSAHGVAPGTTIDIEYYD